MVNKSGSKETGRKFNNFDDADYHMKFGTVTGISY
jgi:hypothetical protein